MKYLLTGLKQKNITHLMLENVVPARTGHIQGYGIGVTFTSKGLDWHRNPTFETTKLLKYSEPTIIPQ